jgi:hypothetical protein
MGEPGSTRPNTLYPLAECSSDVTYSGSYICADRTEHSAKTSVSRGFGRILPISGFSHLGPNPKPCPIKNAPGESG